MLAVRAAAWWWPCRFWERVGWCGGLAVLAVREVVRIISRERVGWCGGLAVLAVREVVRIISRERVGWCGVELWLIF